MATYQGIQYEFKFVTDPPALTVKPLGGCEVEAACHAKRGISPGGKYICGWRVTGKVLLGCFERKRLLRDA